MECIFIIEKWKYYFISKDTFINLNFLFYSVFSSYYDNKFLYKKWLYILSS